MSRPKLSAGSSSRYVNLASTSLSKTGSVFSRRVELATKSSIGGSLTAMMFISRTLFSVLGAL